MPSQPTAGGPRLSRRTLLRGTAAVAVATSLGTAACGRTPATVASLIAQAPFYIAHRGGGGDWPEMTAYAYAQAAKIRPLQALEMSVCLSADGVLVLSHDPTTLRTTGVAETIADRAWADLAKLQVGAAGTVDPSQPARPLSRFDEVVRRYRDDFVIFAEPKVPEAAQPLMDALVALGAPQRVVWKQYVTSPHWEAAKANGFSTWGYLLNQPSHIGDLAKWAGHPEIDMLGAGVAETDAFVSSVVAAARTHGKKTIAWPVATTAQRGRILGLGVDGLMTSNVTEIVPQR